MSFNENVKEIIERGERQVRAYFNQVKLLIHGVDKKSDLLTLPEYIVIPKEKLNDMEYICQEVLDSAEIDYNGYYEVEISEVDYVVCD